MVSISVNFSFFTSGTVYDDSHNHFQTRVFDPKKGMKLLLLHVRLICVLLFSVLIFDLPLCLQMA